MTDLLAARSQMAVSLAFHIIFSTIGMAMPILMATSHFKYLKTKKKVYLDLTKAWSKGVAIFFATGAVSGTALSFELGLLWPGFMEHAGAIIGMPFSLEGTAFFIEAIALGLFLYGWDRLNPWVHWAAGLVVGLSGLISGMFVITANAWMNSPAGFDWVGGQAINIDPWAAMFNQRALNMGLHMLIASFTATGFAVAGLHAGLLLKNPQHEIHSAALKIAFLWGCFGAVLQPISGDLLAKETAELQPLKLAAMEAHFETEKGAHLLIGGIPDPENRSVSYGIKIPYLLSILAYGDPKAEVKGLNQFDPDLWPPIVATHLSFQAMVAVGTFLIFLSFAGLWLLWKKKNLEHSKLFLKVLALSCPLGFIGIECGWMVTELGRQPWIIYGVMKTSDALTPMPGLLFPFMLFTGLYVLLTIILFWLMKRQIEHLPYTASSFGRAS